MSLFIEHQKVFEKAKIIISRGRWIFFGTTIAIAGLMIVLRGRSIGYVLIVSGLLFIIINCMALAEATK